MANFASRIKSLTNIDTTDSTNQTYISDWLTEGSREVINVMPMQCLWNVSTNTDITTSDGISVNNCKILDVVRYDNVDSIDYPCMPMDASLRGRASASSGWMQESTNESPIFYLLNGFIFILPTPDSTSKGKVSVVTYPVVSYDSTFIAQFPNDAEHLVVNYASVRAKTKMILDEIVNFSLPNKPATIPSPSFTYSNAVAGSVSYADVTAFGTAPSYNAPVLSITDKEDTEVSQIEIQEYSSRVQNAIQDFNEANAEYQASIQKELEDARGKLQEQIKNSDSSTQINLQNNLKALDKDIQEYNSKIAKYQADLQSYSSESNGKLQEFSTNLQGMQQELNNLKEQYTESIRSYLSFYNVAQKREENYGRQARV